MMLLPPPTVIVSRFGLPTMMSLPLPAMMVLFVWPLAISSLPSPLVIVSFVPLPAMMMSLPEPVVIESWPLIPKTTSLPPPPVMASLFGVPMMHSLASVPPITVTPFDPCLKGGFLPSMIGYPAGQQTDTSDTATMVTVWVAFDTFPEESVADQITVFFPTWKVVWLLVIPTLGPHASVA